MVLLVAGLVVVWILHVIRTGTTVSTMAAGDSYSYFLPAYVYQAERVSHGGFPFWNPYQGTGVPFLAVLQPGALYPARLLMLIASPPRAMEYSAFLHAILGLVGTYALCRRLGTSTVSAAIATMVFTVAFSLPSVNAPTILEPGAWFPIVALAVVTIVWGGGWPWVFVLALALAMPPLAGGYQMTLYIVYGGGVFALAAALEQRRRGEPLAPRIVGRLAVAGVLALATSAPQLLTTFAWTVNTVRQTKTLTDLQMMPLATELARWQRLSAFFLRYSSADFGYFSIPVVLLAIVGLVRSRPMGMVLGLAALATGALAIAPPSTVLFAVYKAIPGFAMFRFPTRLLQITCLLVAVTAALGLSGLDRLRMSFALLPRRLVEAAAVVVVVAVVVWPYRNNYVLPWSESSTLARPDPQFFPGRTRPSAADRVSVPSERMAFRLDTFVRQGSLQGVRVLQDYEPLSSRRLGNFLAVVWGLSQPRENAFPMFDGSVRGVQWIIRPDLLDLVAVRGIIATADALPQAGAPGWIRVGGDDEFPLYENTRALPRAYVLERARFVEGEDAALAAIGDRGFDPRTDVVLVGTADSAEARALTTGPATPFVAPRIVVDDPERVVLDVDPRRESLLVLADAFAPGWEVSVDGTPRPIWLANYLVRAVPLRAGDRRVEFRYHAPGFALGIAIFCAAWSMMLVASTIAQLRRRPVSPTLP